MRVDGESDCAQAGGRLRVEGTYFGHGQTGPEVRAVEIHGFDPHTGARRRSTRSDGRAEHGPGGCVRLAEREYDVDAFLAAHSRKRHWAIGVTIAVTAVAGAGAVVGCRDAAVRGR